jgi:hypothetical protein
VGLWCIASHPETHPALSGNPPRRGFCSVTPLKNSSAQKIPRRSAGYFAYTILNTQELFDPFDPIFQFLIQLPQQLQILITGLPIPTPIHLQQYRHHLPERMRIHILQPIAHVLILNKRRVEVLVDPVIHSPRRSRPAHGKRQPLR